AFRSVVTPRSPVRPRHPEARRSIGPRWFVKLPWPTDTRRTFTLWWLRHAIASKVLREASPLLVPRHLESIAWIFVFATRTPVVRPSLTPRGDLRSSSRQHRRALFFLRFPKSSASKPLQHSVGMASLQLTQRRDQFVLRVGAEGGGLS